MLTACFATQTSAGRLPRGVSLTPDRRLHDVGSGVATIVLLAAVLLSLRRAPTARRRRAAAWLLTFVVPADVILLALGSTVGGGRQRLVVGAACVWQLALTRDLLRVRGFRAVNVEDRDGPQEPL